MDKDRLAKLGLGAVASYGELHVLFFLHGPSAGCILLASSKVGPLCFVGFVSNLTYGTGLSLSWIAFVHQIGGRSSVLELCTAISAPFAPRSLSGSCREVPLDGWAVAALFGILHWLLHSPELCAPSAILSCAGHGAAV